MVQLYFLDTIFWMYRMHIARFLSTIIAVLSAFWLWADGGYEPLISCLASISTLAGISVFTDKKLEFKHQKNVLNFQRQMPRIETLIEEAKEEIWINGIDFNKMVNLIEVFEPKAKQGIKIKFLAVDVNVNTPLLHNISKFRGIDFGDLTNRCSSNFNRIQEFANNYTSVEFRVFSHRPSIGLFIVDPYDEQGKMTVLIYLYQGISKEEP